MSKIIHQIWLGNKDPPQWFLDSQKKDYLKYNKDGIIYYGKMMMLKFKLINIKAYEYEPI